MSCDVGEATKGLENEALLQPFRRFTYVRAHYTTLPLLHLRHRYLTYVIWRAAHDGFAILLFLFFMKIKYVLSTRLESLLCTDVINLWTGSRRMDLTEKNSVFYFF